MNELPLELRKLAEQNTAVQDVLSSYEQLDAVYQRSLDAMGRPRRTAPAVQNSAEVTMSFQSVSASQGGGAN